MKVRMTSKKKNEQCDLYPKDSLQDGKFDEKGRFKVEGRIDFIPSRFPWVEIDPNTDTKKCDGCNNKFILEAVFVGDTCERCDERYNVVDRD